MNNVGLRWELNKTDAGVLLPGRSVMYHLWRANLGNNATPNAAGQFNLITKDWPILVVDSNGTQTSSDWPPFPLHALDNALADGWCGYQVSGIDVFGRHTPNSASAAWRQWSPMPEPNPWYYVELPGDAVINASAIRLFTKIAPPPPTSTEAYAIDPRDPSVIRDATYSDWWNILTRSDWYKALTEVQKNNLIGLRVRWQWPQTHIDQSPHTREFRIYYQDGSLNAVLGNTTTVTAASTTESTVTTDIQNGEPANSYLGAALYACQDAFVIVGSEAGSPLNVRVRNVGPRDNIAPPANVPCTIATPPAYTSGLASVADGSQVVTGTNTGWTTALEGDVFQFATEQRSYRIAGVSSPTQLVLEEPYEGCVSKRPCLQHSAFAVSSIIPRLRLGKSATSSSLYILHWTAAVKDARKPVRNYDIILPVPDDSAQSGIPLTPSQPTQSSMHTLASVRLTTSRTPQIIRSGPVRGRSVSATKVGWPSSEDFSRVA